MITFTLPHFGEIQLTSLDKYYSAQTDLNGTKIKLDLNFENKTTDSATMLTVKNLIEDIASLDQKNKTYITNDYNDEGGDTVRFYLEHHLEECSREELATLISFDDSDLELAEQLLAKLHLVRIGFYPEDEESFAVFDYSIGKKLTDYLVVVNIDRDSELDYMTMES